MSLETVGLGGILTLNDQQFVRAAGRARTALASIEGASRRVGSGLSQMGAAFGRMTLAAGAVTAMLGLGTAQAVSFEQGMADVQAVLRLSKSEMGGLAAKAKEMGATTQFSASEAAGAMQNLARAGFEPVQIIDSIGAVMSAAAADGMDLATAAEVVSGAVRGMGLEANQAQGAANVLALVSSKSRTNITALGESLRYTMAQARTMAIELPQLGAALGVISDSLGPTTVSGTSLTQMLVKIAKPTKEGAALMARFGAKAKYLASGELDLAGTIETMSSKIDAIKDPISRARAMTELFGIRGQKAFAALTAKGALPKLVDLAKQARAQFTGFDEAGNVVVSAAEQMAKIRLDTVTGAFTILRSNIEGLSIEVFGPLLVGFKRFFDILTGGVTGTGGLGGVVKAIIRLRSGEGLDGIAPSAVAVAKGIKSAVDTIGAQVDRLTTWFIQGKKHVTDYLGPNGLERISRIATLAVVAVGAVAPLMVGLVGFGFALKMIVVPMVSGLISVLGGLASLIVGPVGVALLGVGALFLLLRKDGESVTQTLARGWAWVKATALDLWQNVLTPFVSGFSAMWSAMGEGMIAAWNETKDAIFFAWNSIVSLFSDGTESAKIDWRSVGSTVGGVISGIVAGIAWVVKVGALAIGGLVMVIKLVVHVVKTAFNRVRMMAGVFVGIWTDIYDGISMLFSGEILNGLTRLGAALLDTLLTPLRQIVISAISLADLLGADNLVPAALRRFAEGGIKAVLSQEKAPAAAPARKAAEATIERAAARAPASKEPTAGEKKIAGGLDSLAAGLKNQKIDLKTCVKVDGREVALATSRHEAEITERAGAKATPWNRRMALEHGAVPAPSGAG